MAAYKSHAMEAALNLCRPIGPLSGVTTLAIVAWLATWIVPNHSWKKKSVSLKPIVLTALVLLALGFLLAFPPIADLLPL